MRHTATNALACVLATACCMGAASAADTAGQVITPAGSQASTMGDAARFDGRVRVDPLGQANASINASSAYVSFEPGARSAWHTHPRGQYLIVTAGRGLTQAWGKPVQPLKVGDVVWCPPDVKHWHGAAPDTPMTHLALTGTAAGQSVTWMEKVSDAEYNRR
jgi:quercetin dioxygenase-like cupin family protein